MVCAEAAPAESLDNTSHGIEEVDQLRLIRKEKAAIADRRNENSELDDKGDDETKVAIAH